MSQRYDILVRLLLVGDTGVGKTCLLCQYINKEFVGTHISTIGVDFKVKTVEINGSLAKVQIWDTAGQERFDAITKQFYRRAQGILVVYDITKMSSFEGVSKWVDDIREHGEDDVVLVLVGNKTDRGILREVASERAKRFAEQNNMLFYETNARSPENTDVFADDNILMLPKPDSEFPENLNDMMQEICEKIVYLHNNNMKKESPSTNIVDIRKERAASKVRPTMNNADELDNEVTDSRCCFS